MAVQPATTAPHTNRSNTRLNRAAYQRLVLAALLLLSFTLRTHPALAQAGFKEDLSTPRRALAVFAEASNRGDWDRAVQVLDVPAQASAERRKQAQVVAEQLDYVLSRRLALDLDRFSDQVAGNPTDGVDTEQVAALSAQGRNMLILLTRLENPPRWVFSRGTLARVPELYEQYGPGLLEARMPVRLRVELWGLALWQWLGLVAAILVALAVGYVFVAIARVFTNRLVARNKALWDQEMLRELRRPALALVALVIFVPLARLLALPASTWASAMSTVKVLGIVALCWMALRTINLFSRTVELRALSVDRSSTLSGFSMRGVRTRVRVLRRVVSWVLVLGTAALLLMQVEAVRAVGVSLLASAGVAGIVLGLAAQRTLGSLLAGIQLSISQPIRIGDDVRVEGESGVIEEITLTYVVVKLWDERRLVVPIMRFLEQPFQNMTMVSPELHGTVMLYANFTLPMTELRAEVDKLLATNNAWDRRTINVQVTNLTEHALEVRVLVSAGNGSQLFSLRCELREALVAWLATFEGGRHLPQRVLVDTAVDLGVGAPGPSRAERPPVVRE
jgi:small-conductance mechanosensitive channel